MMRVVTTLLNEGFLVLVSDDGSYGYTGLVYLILPTLVDCLPQFHELILYPPTGAILINNITTITI